MAALSDAEHNMVVAEVNDRIRGSSWTQDTELLARGVDLLGQILAHLQAGLVTADADLRKSKNFGRPDYPDPVKRPDWLAAEEPDEKRDDRPPLVSPGALAAAFAQCN